jgi:protein phosphatase
MKSGDELSRALHDDLTFAATRANDSILKLAKRQPDYEGMGSTLVIAVMLGERICIAHLGDSRAYRFANGRTEQLTRDHCWLDEQVASGELSVDALNNSRFKNIVTRALGIEDEVDLEVREHEAGSDDIFMLCSDGLSDMVTQAEMEAILSSDDSLEARAKNLVRLANENGGKDNISVALIRIAATAKEGWAKRLLHRLQGHGAA